MGTSKQAVTLSAEAVEELYAKLKDMRHDINNKLANIQACVELVRYKPAEVQRLFHTVPEQTPKIQQCLAEFSIEFEKALSISKD